MSSISITSSMYIPAALAAFDDLDASDDTGTVGQGHRPGRRGELTIGQISVALKRASRRAPRFQVAINVCSTIPPRILPCYRQ